MNNFLLKNDLDQSSFDKISSLSNRPDSVVLKSSTIINIPIENDIYKIPKKKYL
jgi:hypothetical protein